MAYHIPKPEEYLPQGWFEDYLRLHPEDNSDCDVSAGNQTYDRSHLRADEVNYSGRIELSWEDYRGDRNRGGDRPAHIALYGTIEAGVITPNTGRSVNMTWSQNGEQRRQDDKPSSISTKMDQSMYYMNWFEDNSYVERPDGGPNYVRYDGSTDYVLEWKDTKEPGRLHRVGGPAQISSGGASYYQKGVLHREDGPAMETDNGFQAWAWRGKLFENEQQWLMYKEGVTGFGTGTEAWPRGMAEVIDIVQSKGDVRWSWGRCLQELRIQRRSDAVLRAFQVVRALLPLRTEELVQALRQGSGHDLVVDVRPQDTKHEKYTVRNRPLETVTVVVRRSASFDEALRRTDPGLVAILKEDQFHFGTDSLVHMRIDLRFSFSEPGGHYQEGWLIEELQSDWLQHAGRLFKDQYKVEIIRRLWEHLPEIALRMAVDKARSRGVEAVLMTTDAIQRTRWKKHINGPAPFLDSTYKALPRKLGFEAKRLVLGEFQPDWSDPDFNTWTTKDPSVTPFTKTFWVFDTSQRLRRIHATIRQTLLEVTLADD